MTRKEAEDFVYKSYLKAESHQDYASKDAEKRRPDLTRDLIRSKSLTPCAIVTGSKGKGSVSNMISAILQTKYKIGLMTSPHITFFNERFRINDDIISDNEFVRYMENVEPLIEAIDKRIDDNICVSPMGIQAVLALDYFFDNNTDFNVFECGKGAKYDDVNNIIHEYAVINSIFLEHTRELGGSLVAIAEDKSHVITGEQKAVFISEQQDEVMEVLLERAKSCGTIVKRYGKDFRAENIQYDKRGMIFDIIVDDTCYKEIMIPLMGKHQAKNCALAMALCKDVLGEINIDLVKDKLRRLNWPGRLEVLSTQPFVLLDACINAASCENVKETLNYLNIHDVSLIIGIPNDKDYLGVIKEMENISDKIILTKSQNPHYVFSDIQCEKAMEIGIVTIWKESISEAVETAKSFNKPIIILGTTSIVSEVKHLFS